MDRGLCRKAGGGEGLKGIGCRSVLPYRNIGTAANVKVAEIIS